MKRLFFFVQIVSFCISVFSSFAMNEDLLRDPTMPYAKRAICYKMACLRDLVAYLREHDAKIPDDVNIPGLEESVSLGASEPITFENEGAYIKLNDTLEEVAREIGLSWPRIPQTPFDVEVFRAKVLERLLDGTQEPRIGRTTPIRLLYEDARNPASAFAVVRKRPLEVKFYEMTQALGLDVIVPTIRLREDSEETAAVFQRPVEWELIPHLSMQSLLLIDLFAEPNGSCPLLSLKRMQEESMYYTGYFRDNVSKENIDQIWLYWALFRPYDAEPRNTMVTISSTGKFEFKFIDIERVTRRQPFLPAVLTPSWGISAVYSPFCMATLNLLKQWKHINLEIFDIEPEFTDRLDGVHIRIAFKLLRDQGSFWDTIYTLSDFMRHLPTVPSLLDRGELRVRDVLPKEEAEQALYVALREMIGSGEDKTLGYFQKISQTASITQEYLRYTLYLSRVLNMDTTKWDYEEQERIDFDELDRNWSRGGNHIALEGLMLYSLGLGSLEIDEGRDNLANFFFRRIVSGTFD